MGLLRTREVKDGAGAAACIDGAHPTAATPRQLAGEVPPRGGERVREVGTLRTTLGSSGVPKETRDYQSCNKDSAW
jgi:hypothetical protein